LPEHFGVDSFHLFVDSFVSGVCMESFCFNVCKLASSGECVELGSFFRITEGVGPPFTNDKKCGHYMDNLLNEFFGLNALSSGVFKND